MGRRTVAIHPAELPEVVAGRLKAAPVVLDGFSPAALVGVARGRDALIKGLGWAAEVDLWLSDVGGSRWVRVGASDFELITLLDNGAALVSTLDVEPWTWPLGGWYAEAVPADELVAAHDARVVPVARWEQAAVWAAGADRAAAAVSVDVWRRCVQLRHAGTQRLALIDQLGDRLPPEVLRRYELNQVVNAVTLALVRLVPSALAALDGHTKPDELVAFLTQFGSQFLPVLSAVAAADVVDTVATDLGVTLAPEARERLVARLSQPRGVVVQLDEHRR